MRRASPSHSCHTVAGGAVCVECNGCGHRTALTSPLFFRGNMKELRSLNLRCTKCEASDIALYLPNSIKEAEDWARGTERLE